MNIHKARYVHLSRYTLDACSYVVQVVKLKNTYLAKVRKADEAEDE